MLAAPCCTGQRCRWGSLLMPVDREASSLASRLQLVLLSALHSCVMSAICSLEQMAWRLAGEHGQSMQGFCSEKLALIRPAEHLQACSKHLRLCWAAAPGCTASWRSVCSSSRVVSSSGSGWCCPLSSAGPYRSPTSGLQSRAPGSKTLKPASCAYWRKSQTAARSRSTRQVTHTACAALNLSVAA